MMVTLPISKLFDWLDALKTPKILFNASYFANFVTVCLKWQSDHFVMENFLNFL